MAHARQRYMLGGLRFWDMFKIESTVKSNPERLNHIMITKKKIKIQSFEKSRISAGGEAVEGLCDGRRRGQFAY